jgi:hypothetical protein
MAALNFHKEGADHVSDSFTGGHVVQLTFAKEGTQVLYTETRINADLEWKPVDSHVTEKNMVVNIPAAGETQEFRLKCHEAPTGAEITPRSNPDEPAIATEEEVRNIVRNYNP